jgi:hypothetical protein
MRLIVPTYHELKPEPNHMTMRSPIASLPRTLFGCGRMALVDRLDLCLRELTIHVLLYPAALAAAGAARAARGSA